jgi:hypothetical protein
VYAQAVPVLAIEGFIPMAPSDEYLPDAFFDDRDGKPIYLAIQQPPSARAQDKSVVLSVAAGIPPFHERANGVEVEMPLEFAKHLIVELRKAVEELIRKQGG